MYTNKVIHYKKFFKNINYKKLMNEIVTHKKKLQQINYNIEGGAVLNFIDENYLQLNKILKKLYNSKKINNHFKSKFIINSCSAICDNENYKRSSRWHRDVRYFNKNAHAEMILCIIPVTICDKNNGSTTFKLRNKKIIQKKLLPGDILIADASLLHKAGKKKNINDRVIITIALTPPHIKPIMDYSEIFKKFRKKKVFLKQLLGYNSRTPKTHKQFFKSDKERFFQKDQIKNF